MYRFDFVPSRLNMRAALRVTALCTLAIAASGCSRQIKEINREPEMSKVGQTLAPEQTAYSAYPSKPSRPVSKFSTWNDGASSLFTSKRALVKGDILTVSIEINDKAKLTNKSDRSRTSGRTLGISGEFDVAGAGSDASLAGRINSGSDFAGNGGTTRAETIKLSVAAIVVRVLHNGNLIIQGSQEVRVNAELRILTITGIVRPSDIEPDNTIAYDRIAEARVSYGGRGRISEVQQPPYGQQLLDIISPL